MYNLIHQFIDEGVMMYESTFNRVYNPETKCYANYRDRCNHLQSGLILDGLYTSLSGIRFVYIDNRTISIKLCDIISITDSHIKWVV